MELGLNNSLLAGDPRLIDHIVGEVKSQGIFDQFRKECIADVDTKPAYQNLRTRVEGSVSSFLNKQTWRTDLNKNQLRETLRKHIHEAPYLEVGVERIVDQVVNPKIFSVFMPQIEDVVYKFLGIERPKAQRNGSCDLKDLLPKDLDPVSPESDRNSLKDISLESVDENVNEITNGDEQKLSNNNIEDTAQVTEPKCETPLPVKKEEKNVENGENIQEVVSSPVKTILNSSFKSDETNKTEEEEEDSPVFEPIDIMNLNESNMSNDSLLSGISELTSHRSRSPDFITEFSRDNFDCSNQDSQLSKVSSNSRLSIVTDFGSSNHASTPIPESKEDSRYTKDNFNSVREFDTNKDNKFNFEVIKSKDNIKTSNFSKENSRDASEYKESKSKERSSSKSRHSRDKHDMRNSKDKDRDSRRHHSSKSDKYSRSKSKDKNVTEFQESKENSGKYKDNKTKEIEKKEDSSKEIKDLKDLYKEKIRELREKKELTEKEKLSKYNKDSKLYKEYKEKKDFSSSRDKDDYKKSHKSSSSSSSRSSSYHNSRSSRNSESKDSRDRSGSKRDDRRHSNGKSESKSNNKSKRDLKSETKSDSRNSDKSVKDKKRRDEKKSKSTDDHSSLRKNSNDRRSTDRDGSNGSSSKYSHKSSYGTNNSSNKFGPSTNLTKDNGKEHHSSSEASDSVHDSLQTMFESDEHAKSSSGYNNLDNPPKKVDPGTAEICLPLKKRPLHNEESISESHLKKPKIEEKKTTKKKIEKDIFKIDMDVTSVPDEERVQIIEIPDEEWDQPYPDKEPILSLEETKKIILDAEPVHLMQSKLSEMEQSIKQSLSEMMSDQTLAESEGSLISTKLTPVMSSSTLLESLTDESNNDSENSLPVNFNVPVVLSANIEKNNEMIEKQMEEIMKGNIENTFSTITEENNEKNSKNIMLNDQVSEKNIKKDEENQIKNVQTNKDKMFENMTVDIQETKKNNKENIELTKIESKETKQKFENNSEKIEVDIRTTKDKIQDIVDHNKSEKIMEDSLEEINQNINDNVEKIKIKLKEFKEIIEQQFYDNMNKIETNIKNATEIEINTGIIPESSKKNIHNHVEKIAIDVKMFEETTDQNSNDNLKLENANRKEFIKKSHKINKDNIKITNVNIKDVSANDMIDHTKITNVDIKVTEQKSEEVKTDNETKIIETGQFVNVIEYINDDRKRVNNVVDEFNKDNKLIINEEFGEKETIENVNSFSKSKDCVKEKFVQLTENKESSNNLINTDKNSENEKLKYFENDDQHDTKQNQVVKVTEENRLKIKTIINNDNNKELSEVVDDDKKSAEFTEFTEHVTQKQIKDKLIDELNKHNEDNSNVEKPSIEQQCEKSNVEIIQTTIKIQAIENTVEKNEIIKSNIDNKIEKLSDQKNNIIDEKIITLKENKINEKKIVQPIESNDHDNNDGNIQNNLVNICDQKNDQIEEELTLIFNKCSSNTSATYASLKVEEINTNKNISEKIEKQSFDRVEENLLEIPTTSKVISSGMIIQNRTDVVVSPIEEDCLYLESDNQKYLSFKKFLEKLEANPNRNLEDMIESYGGTVVSAVPMAAPTILPKRKSTSPLSDILITNSNNNNDGKETATEETNEETVTIAKKRKVGRIKKIGNTIANVTHSQSHQQLQQQPQASVVNGENFVMPLSPESDVSASSEKNPGNALKEEKGRQRSSQRYSSDDLYKPRPLFSSSSRRNRRFNPA